MSGITWSRVAPTQAYTFVEFEIAGGVLEPGELPRVSLPPEALARPELGLVLSGRGPVWLYAHLAHLGHAFAWVGVFEPRRAGAVVVQRHRADAPEVGSVVDVSAAHPEIGG